MKRCYMLNIQEKGTQGQRPLTGSGSSLCHMNSGTVITDEALLYANIQLKGI